MIACQHSKWFHIENETAGKSLIFQVHTHKHMLQRPGEAFCKPPLKLLTAQGVSGGQMWTAFMSPPV